MTFVSVALNRRLTKYFIADDPTPITLKTRTWSTSGGSKEAVNGPDRLEQIFKVIYDGSTGQVNTADGQTRKFDFILVGEYNASVAIGDYWDEGSQRYTIDYVFPDNGWEKKCGGTSHGISPSHG